MAHIFLQILWQFLPRKTFRRHPNILSSLRWNCVRHSANLVPRARALPQENRGAWPLMRKNVVSVRSRSLSVVKARTFYRIRCLPRGIKFWWDFTDLQLFLSRGSKCWWRTCLFRSSHNSCHAATYSVTLLRILARWATLNKSNRSFEFTQ